MKKQDFPKTFSMHKNLLKFYLQKHNWNFLINIFISTLNKSLSFFTEFWGFFIQKNAYHTVFIIEKCLLSFFPHAEIETQFWLTKRLSFGNKTVVKLFKFTEKPSWKFSEMLFVWTNCHEILIYILMGAQTIRAKTIQPKVYRNISLRQFSQFYKTLDSNEKIGIGDISRFYVASGRPKRASPQ